MIDCQTVSKTSSTWQQSNDIGSYRSSPILRRKECHTALFSLVFPTALLEFAKSIHRASRNMTTDDVNILVEYISRVLVNFVQLLYVAYMSYIQGLSLLVQSKNMLIQHIFTSLYKYSFDQYDQYSSQKGSSEIRMQLKARSN